MKIFLALIFICSVILANPVPDISLVSRNDDYLLAVKTTLDDPQISYQPKGNDLLIVIKAPSIIGKDTSFITQYDSSFVVSTMVTKITEGSINILLKNTQLSVNNIREKQEKNAVFFYWGATKPLNNNTAQNTSVVKADAETKKSAEPVIEIIETFPLDLVVDRNIVNLRQLPSADAAITGKAKQGEKLTAAQKKEQWYQVKDKNGVFVWIHESVVSIQEPQSIEEYSTPVTPPTHTPIKDSVKTEIADNTVNNIDTTAVVAVIEPKKNIAYKRKGRDPFLPLDKSNFIREGLLNINDVNIELVGILYDAEDAIALFEERRDKEIISFAMKVGDPVVSGKLLKIEQNRVVFLLRETDFSYTVEKELNVN